MDKLPTGPEALPNVESRPIYKVLDKALSDQRTISLDEAGKIIMHNLLGSWSDEKGLEKLLRENGWSVVHTFQGV